MLEPLDALLLAQHLGHVVLQRCVLRCVFELELLHPTPPRMGPGPTALRMALAVAKQVFREPMLRARGVTFGSLSPAHQISQRFVLRVRNPDRRQVAAAMTASQLLGVSTVRLDPLARLLRCERRGDHIARDAHLRELPVESVARWPRLVADAK